MSTKNEFYVLDVFFFNSECVSIIINKLIQVLSRERTLVDTLKDTEMAF